MDERNGDANRGYPKGALIGRAGKAQVLLCTCCSFGDRLGLQEITACMPDGPELGVSAGLGSWTGQRASFDET